jgi:T5SS/PEP-CTERM-associated repeat protein/autotransporter-associated beta strand protein
MTVSSNIYVGPDGGIGNMALVSGSTLTSNNELYVGYNGGVGTMTVSNGSHIQVNGWSQIGRDSVSGIGSGTLTLNDTSTMTVTREFRLGRWGAGVGVMNMNDSSHLEMGGDEAWIGTDTGNGTLVMSGSSSANAGNNIQIGRNTGSTGTLTMSGSSSLWEANEFRLGWQGGTGNLNMSGTSYISANHFGNIGRDGGSSAIINMTGSSKMISRYWELSYGSNGGHAAVTMNGDNAADYVSIGNAAGYASDTYWISFGRDAGSTATLTMSGYSRVNTGYNVDIGVWGANATATMAGNAEILGGELNVGYEGTGSLVMSGSSANWINGEYRIGVGAGNGSVTIGSTTGTAIISVGGHLRVGYNGGTGTLNINPGASIGVNQWLQVGNNDGGGAGVGIVNMTGGTITKNAVADTFLIIGRTGTGTWTQSGGLADIRTGVTMGNGGYTGTLNLDGGVFSTGFIQAGYEADAAAIMRINFDGGTLKVNTDSIYAAAGGANFVTPYSSTDALITIEDGGAIVDTSGNDVAIAVNIAEDPLSTGGSFTKIGGGTLTLTGSVGYTGDTIVNVGGLTVNAGLNTPTATVYVANGTTLTTPSLVADTLVIGGGPYAAAATAAVPEPGTFVLLGLAGAIALLAIRRRK